MDQLHNYYLMIRNGYLSQIPTRPEGFNFLAHSFLPSSNIPAGVMVERHWKSLTLVEPLWRSGLGDEYKSAKVEEMFAQGDLKPMVFTDVDFALIGRDAQGHIDQYVVDRATLEALGFIAQYYEELQDPNIHLSTIKGSSSSDRCFEIGQDLFHSCILGIAQDPNAFISASYASEFLSLVSKAPGDLTDDDFRAALDNIEDSFFELVVNPLESYTAGQSIIRGMEAQSGHDRMTHIYTMIAAFSHSQVPEEEMLRHGSFSDFNADEHLYPGVRAFFGKAEAIGLEVVGITRGNQFPFMEGSASNIEDLFHRVHSTLISSKRQSRDRDPLHPNKKIRSYSIEIDNMDTADKVRIMLHETLEMFARKRVNFQNAEELLAAVATYLDHCIFVTDSDLEAWGTCPTVGVLAIRTPTRKVLDDAFEKIESLDNPIALINPQDRNDPLLGFESNGVFASFEPEGTGLGELLDDMARGLPLQHRYLANGPLVQESAVRSR